MATTVESGADGVRWDLTPLAPGEEEMKDRLESATSDAAAFVERWPAESLAEIEPEQLATLLGELASLRAAREEGRVWAMLLTWTDGANPSVLDIEAWVNERLPRLDEAIRHFELAWMAVPDECALQVAGNAAVAADRHYLLSSRRFRPFSLSPAEERVLAARDASASAAWKGLRDRTLGGLVVCFDDGSGAREWGMAELGAVRRAHPDRDLRRKANEATNPVVASALPVIAQCFDALVGDRLAVDRLRGHAGPMEASLLQNEVDSSIVEGLLSAAEANVGVAHRWFELKARLLGLARLDVIDLFAPPFDSPDVSWEDGRRLASDVFAGLSPSLGAEAERFFGERRIDSEPRRGKPGGAFCEWPSTRTPGFVFLNWHGRLSDVSVLAHELGHGTHFALAARAQTDLSFLPGPTVAEVPSTFAEFLLVERLLGQDEALGRGAVAAMLDQASVAVWMATAFMRFELRAYELRADGQALNPERLGELSDSALADFKGDVLTDELGIHTTLWALFPHFVHERFYMHSYVSAFLLAAGLLRRAAEPGFVERYELFLAAGGSAPPDELLGMLGVDLRHPDVWSDGFQVLDGWIDRLA